MQPAVIALEAVRREFFAGEGTVVALRDIDLVIHAGEMVAIVGASGSGKSTLMNLIGCIDRPSSGSYRISGRETALLDIDELAALRREHFGFIFQRYHLLAELSAFENVEMPAIYGGLPRRERAGRAAGLLNRLAMQDRASHRPGQLSGGQQQRVSIARALMNDADVILADEPTGALDSKVGEGVLEILDELHAQGHTVIIVTHDMAVARRAERVIELRDGIIVADRGSEGPRHLPMMRGVERRAARWRTSLDRLEEGLRMALASMKAHRLRTFLTMLGIIIGVASVVCVVALGEGSRRKVLSNISNLGTNTLEIFPGRDFGDVRSAKIKTLVIADARALAGNSYVAAVTPTVSASNTLRYGTTEASALVNGVSEQYPSVKGTRIAEGRFFDAEAVWSLAQDVVIDENARKALFADLAGSPIGQIILIGKVPCRIVGLIRQQQGGFGSSASPSVYLPYATVQARFVGDSSLRSISVRVADDTPMDFAEQDVTRFLTQRHGTKDFFVLNTDDIRQTITGTTQVLTLLIAAIALISLLVGGIGVMNIMLVSVSERTAEIGIRMAIGARRSDILQQFLIEAVLVCLLGGTLGIVTALGFGALISLLVASFSLIYSPLSIAVAFLCSTLIGLAFGYVPARNASLLDPVVALSR